MNSPNVSLRVLAGFTQMTEDDDDTIQPSSPSKSTAQSALANAAAGVSSLSRVAISSLSGNQKLKDLVGSSPDETEETRFGRNSQELGELERRMRQDLGGLDLNQVSEHEMLENVGFDARRTARAQEADVKRVLGGKGGLGRVRSFDGTLTSETFSSSRSSTGLHQYDSPDLLSGQGVEVSNAAPEMNGGE